MRSTGFPLADAENDFLRARRRHTLGRLAARLRRDRAYGSTSLVFDEVVAALGWQSERRLGLQTIPVKAIVGSVNRSRDFDARFRPASGRVRSRWQRIDTAHRKGEAIPPIDVYRVGDLYFIRDGHHRVSVARELGLPLIDAIVTEVRTRIPAGESTMG